MHILIAPNAFKNALSAADAAKAIEKGLQLSPLNCTTTCFPIADGGDGTAALIVETCKGEIVYHTVNDPLGRPVTSKFGLIDNGNTAVIEMADASGLRLIAIDELDPMTASSAGTGQLITAALDAGVTKIVIAMGGSATVDGGCGMLSALGLRFLDSRGQALAPQPKELLKMASIDTSAIDQRIFDREVVILCDVNNLLLGDEGAAAVFGPQKGATPHQVVELDQFLTLFNALTVKQFGKDMSTQTHGGTAGGAGVGLWAYVKAKLVNGIDNFLQLTGFEAELQKADLLITAEGSIDVQTLQGKGPFGVAQQAKLKNLPVIGLAGLIPLEHSADLQQYFDMLFAIGNGPTDLPTAIKNTETNLTRTAMMIGASLTFTKTH